MTVFIQLRLGTALCLRRVCFSAAVLVCLLALSRSLVAQGKIEAAKVGQTDPPKNDPLVNSAMPTPLLTRDRIGFGLFNTLRASVDNKKALDVANQARRLLELPGDRWFGEGQVLRGLRNELFRQMDALPADLREISLKDANARAEQDLATAFQTNNIPELLKSARRYQGTPAALSALRQAALRCWDRGDFVDAAMISARCLPLPDMATVDQLPIILHTAAARVRSGEPLRARQLLEQFARLFDNQSAAEAQKKIDAVLASYALPSLSKAFGNPDQFVFPAVSPRYSKQVLKDPRWNEFFDLARRDGHNASSVILPAAFPVIADGRLLLRTFTSLLALDLLTGEKLWECEAMFLEPNPQLARSSLDNLSFRDLMSQELFKYLVLNQVSGGCVADAEKAYFIAERYIPMPEIRKYAQPGSGGPRNQLMACRLIDGAIAWQAWVSAELADISFLSQPVLQSGRLYVLGETEAEIRLFVLNCADGKLDWQLPLVTNDKLSLLHHPTRKLRQLKLLWQDGFLICPTGAGCVVAIDSVTRSYEWAYRYPTQEQLPAAAGRLNAGGTNAAKVVPHPEWQRIDIVRDEARVYFATPESNQLHAVNAANGELVWQQPRQDGVYLAGLIAGKLVVVGQKSLKALDPATGNMIWQHEIESPSGCGCVQGGNYLLPLATGKVLLVDVATGKVLRGAHGDQQALGNLVQSSGVLVSLTPKSLEVYGSWEAEHNELLARLKEKPDDPQLLKLMYGQMRRGGDMSQVVELLRATYQKDPLPAIRVQLVIALIENLTTNPERRSEFLKELEPLTKLLGKQPDELRCRIQAALAMEDRPAALAAAIELASLVTQEEFEIGPDKSRQVRSDRALQGLMIGIVRESPVGERPALNQLLDDALLAARNSRDPFMLQKFATQMSELPCGQEARVRDRHQIRIGWPIYRQELNLLDLARHPDQKLAATSLWALAQDLNDRSFRRDAGRYDRLLLDRFPEIRLDSTQTVAEVIATLPQDSLLNKEIQHGPVDPWPLTSPVVSQPAGNPRAPLMPVPVEAPSDSLLDRINVSIPSKPGFAPDRLVCQGDIYPGYWEIPLPNGRPVFEGQEDTYQGWGLGQLLVVRFGTQIHGVSLLDDNGEPKGRVVWSLDLTEDLMPVSVVHLRDRQGLGGSEAVVVDEYGREVGQIYVMLPGYFCYRHREEIVVVETATGRIAWRRRIDQPNLRITGDSAFIYLVDTRRNQVELLRVVDGASEQVVPLKFAADGPLVLDGSLAVVTESVNLQESNSDDAESTRKKGSSRSLALRWYRLNDMQLLQEYPYPRSSRKLLLDKQTLGVLYPNRVLNLFDLATGRKRGEVKLEYQDVSQIHVWQDPFRFYILPSSIPPKYALHQVPQVRNGHRQSLVHGTLHAIDRKTTKLTWKRKLEETVIAQDQPHGAPVFLFNFQTLAPNVKEPSSPPAAGELESVLQVLDRRTGKDVYYERSAKQAPDATVELNIDDHWLDIHGVTQRIRLEYPQK